MITRIKRIEHAARIAFGNTEHNDPLPPGPNFGPFGYFRLGVLIFAAVIAIIGLLTLV